jgi:hypothetical protein
MWLYAGLAASVLTAELWAVGPACRWVRASARRCGMKGLRQSPTLRLVLVLLLWFPVALPIVGWSYTSIQLAHASARGVYDSAEEGMRSRLQEQYEGIEQIDVLYAGTNSFDGSRPHIWYVIAEVRARSRADGSSLGENGCDAPGSFFLQTKEGWVWMSEGWFPQSVGFWMDVFGMAGPGQSTPSTDWSPSQPARFCTGYLPASEGE